MPAAGTESKMSGEEKKIIIPLPHGACIDRNTRTGCNVFDLLRVTPGDYPPRYTLNYRFIERVIFQFNKCYTNDCSILFIGQVLVDCESTLIILAIIIYRRNLQ